jgi:hypothetical protein
MSKTTAANNRRLRKIDLARLQSDLESCDAEIEMLTDRIEEHLCTMNLDPDAHSKIRRLQIARDIIAGEKYRMQEELAELQK